MKTMNLYLLIVLTLCSLTLYSCKNVSTTLDKDKVPADPVSNLDVPDLFQILMNPNATALYAYPNQIPQSPPPNQPGPNPNPPYPYPSQYPQPPNQSPQYPVQYPQNPSPSPQCPNLNGQGLAYGNPLLPLVSPTEVDVFSLLECASENVAFLSDNSTANIVVLCNTVLNGYTSLSINLKFKNGTSIAVNATNCPFRSVSVHGSQKSQTLCKVTAGPCANSLILIESMACNPDPTACYKDGLASLQANVKVVITNGTCAAVCKGTRDLIFPSPILDLTSLSLQVLGINLPLIANILQSTNMPQSMQAIVLNAINYQLSATNVLPSTG